METEEKEYPPIPDRCALCLLSGNIEKTNVFTVVDCGRHGQAKQNLYDTMNRVAEEISFRVGMAVATEGDPNDHAPDPHVKATAHELRAASALLFEGSDRLRHAEKTLEELRGLYQLQAAELKRFHKIAGITT